MKNNTKKNIIDKARELFNQYGFGQVTLRMIANELSMSCGNLNYHFKKREDILEVLYFEMAEVFDKRIDTLANRALSISHLYNEVRVSMDRMYIYRFFWTDIYNLLRINPTIKEHFQTVYEQRIKGCLFLFQTFQTQGLLRTESYKKEHQQLAEQLTHFGNTWWYGTALYVPNLAESITKGTNQYVAILYPYLTKKGQEELRTIMPSFFGV
jgi:AcrR family transcriptional regulator